MKTAAKVAGLTLLGVGLMACGCAKKGFTSWKYIKDPELAEQLKTFVAEKEAESDADTNPMPKEFKRFFSEARKGDWLEVSNIYINLANQEETNGLDPMWRGTYWETAFEIFNAIYPFGESGEKYPVLYGKDIIQSIPRDSIFLTWGGQGYFTVSVLQKSQARGDPFFMLSRSALNEYDYNKSMYGGKIYTPTYEDATHCYDQYFAEVQSRMRNDPGGTRDNDTADDIWAMDRMLSKVVFDKNTNREFYVEGFAWGWMYPLLEPHGLIFKLNRQPLPALSDEMIQRDGDYWRRLTSPMIGDWLNEDTTVSNIAVFADKVFLQHDFSGFNGDTNFVRNPWTGRMFSEDRANIAELYDWRAQHAHDASEKKRMNHEADFAFRQAWALCPCAPAAVFGYAKYLKAEGRSSEAVLIAETANDFHSDPGLDETLGTLITQLKHATDTNNSDAAYIKNMEDEAVRNPSDYQNIFSLAGCYVQMQKTNHATELLLRTISRPNVPSEVLRSAAQFFAQISDYPNLKTILIKMTAAEPDVPETWYDLSRLDVMLGDKEEAIQYLRTAINLSDLRLKTNSEAFDIRSAARKSTSDFSSISNAPDFKKLVSP